MKHFIFFACLLLPITVSAQINHLIITEIQIGSEISSKDEFIELFNPTQETVSIKDWKLIKKTQSGVEEYNLVAKFSDIAVEPNQYLLIAHPSEFKSTVVPDIVYSNLSNSLAKNNAVYLLNPDKQIIDVIGFGEIHAIAGQTVPENPQPGQSLERKKDDSGNYIHTGRNSDDFFLQTTPNPQNTNSAREPSTPQYLPPAVITPPPAEPIQNSINSTQTEIQTQPNTSIQSEPPPLAIQAQAPSTAAPPLPVPLQPDMILTFPPPSVPDKDIQKIAPDAKPNSPKSQESNKKTAPLKPAKAKKTAANSKLITKIGVVSA
ncbi:MAG: lamin tail domain-containing protein, partial [Parcubacteria group bacterium]|nr:lamin tail domain-containing protein [Parcubacteria group bacterium]